MRHGCLHPVSMRPGGTGAGSRTSQWQSTVYIATKVRTGLTPAVNALGLTLIGLTILAAVAYELMCRAQIGICAG